MKKRVLFPQKQKEKNMKLLRPKPFGCLGKLLLLALLALAVYAVYRGQL